MIKKVLSALCILSAVAVVSAPVPVSAKTDLSVNVNLGAPPVVVEGPRVFVQEPPEMVVIPRSSVYFAPGMKVDLFFHNDWWWTRDSGRWYRSREPRGGWGLVAPNRVPREVIQVRPDYRDHYIRERHVPYGQLKKHWREREIERRERRGEWREEKHERKQHEKEMKRERKEDRRDDRDDRRDDRDDRRDDRNDRGRGHGRD